jgi:hypothetical protein
MAHLSTHDAHFAEFGDEYGSDMEDMDEDAGSDDFEDMDSEGDDDDDDEDDDEGDEGAEPKFVEIEDETPQPAAYVAPWARRGGM